MKTIISFYTWASQAVRFFTSSICAQLAIIVKTPHLPNGKCCADIAWPGPSRVYRLAGFQFDIGPGPGYRFRLAQEASLARPSFLLLHLTHRYQGHVHSVWTDQIALYISEEAVRKEIEDKPDVGMYLCNLLSTGHQHRRSDSPCQAANLNSPYMESPFSMRPSWSVYLHWPISRSCPRLVSQVR
jgi:hypothetical protein